MSGSVKLLSDMSVHSELVAKIAPLHIGEVLTPDEVPSSWQFLEHSLARIDNLCRLRMKSTVFQGEVILVIDGAAASHIPDH